MAEFIWGMFVGAGLAVAAMSFGLAYSAFKNIHGHRRQED